MHVAFRLLYLEIYLKGCALKGVSNKKKSDNNNMKKKTILQHWRCFVLQDLVEVHVVHCLFYKAEEINCIEYRIHWTTFIIFHTNGYAIHTM